jgi:4-hydroxythreonine-4-phosphate dehydrogenase
MTKLKIGITMGDINGIGPEVIIKALDNEFILEHCTIIIYGSSKSISYHKNIVNPKTFSFSICNTASSSFPNKVNLVNCWNEDVQISLGTVGEEGGKFAYIALDRAMQEYLEGHLDALVTAPIHKKSMQLAGFPHKGHTEFLAEISGGKDPLMTLISEDMKVALMSAHIPVKEVVKHVSKAKLLKTLSQFNESLKIDFGIEKPTIAVLGLNPHAGDSGAIGSEEEEMIIPAIMEAKGKGIIAMGPYAADGFFGSAQYKKFDGILAMYHDQGLVGFKALSFGNGVNFTAGLDIIRTSPDHGTGFDIVGKNIADEGSMRKAIYAALDIARNRKAYHEDRKNALKQKPKQSELAEE